MTANLKDPQLNDRLEEWQFHYNWYRSHSSLKGKSPMDIVTEKSPLMPLWEDKRLNMIQPKNRYESRIMELNES